MAQKLIFDNKSTVLPGVYTSFTSGITNPPISATFGNVLIIDTGRGAGYAGGSGIAGTLKSGKDSIYSFQRLQDYRNHVKGSLLWLLGEPLFQPQGAGNAPGVPLIHFVKAAATTPAEISFTFTGGGANGGTFVSQVRDEGTCGNGVEDSNNNLTRGYAGVMRASTLDPTQFVIDFYVGTYKGADSEGDPWDFVADTATEPKLLVSSPQFTNISTLIAWAKNDFTYNQYFKYDAVDSSVSGTGLINSADLIANAGNTLAAGGTETYSTTHLDTVLDNITELDYTFVLATDYAGDAISSDNSKILSHIVNEAKYRKFMFVGGGNDETAFEDGDLSSGGAGSSIETAEFYDSERVIVVHAGCKLRRRGASGFKDRDSIYKAALVLGRIAGNAPQVPVTFKSLRMDGDRHLLNTIDQTKAQNSGVLCTIYDTDFGAWTVLQGINTLQDNEFFITDDGKSHEISIECIKAQLSKEIEINAKRSLLGQTNGVNRNTLTAEDGVQWLDTFLATQTATETTDNLITSYRNITTQFVGDTLKFNYSFDPSFPINKLLFIGKITDSTLV